jgi:hypothetical protein
VALACNPSYSGRRDQENRGSKPDGQIVQETHLKKKKPSQNNRATPQGVGPEFKPQNHKINK